MKISEIIDPTPEYRRRKGELDRIIAADPLSRKVELMKSREGDDGRHLDPEYQRKLQYFDKLRKVHVARWKDLAPRVSRLKGEAMHHKLRDQPSGIFVSYDTVPGVESPAYLDEIGLLIHQQNASLESPADEAITRFVGHAHGFNSAGQVGFWSEGALEDAYSDNPNEKGHLIRQQLEAGMAPIKQLLRTRFGDTIYLYRSQRPLEPGQKHRGVLSWTASQRFANYHGGDTFQKIEKAIPLEDIVWITDRANQQEFICFNRRGASHYLGATMVEAVQPSSEPTQFRSDPRFETIRQKAQQGLRVWRGVRPEGPADPGDFGTGTYYSTSHSRSNAHSGGQNLRQYDIRFSNPIVLAVKDAYDLADRYGTVRGLNRQAGAMQLNRDLRAAGFDGLISVNVRGVNVYPHRATHTELELVDLRLTESMSTGFNPRPWLTGKCFDFALALHERMPDAEFVVIGSPQMPEHVALRRGNVYYDARGAISDMRSFLAHHAGNWSGDPAELIMPISRADVELHAGVAGFPPPYRGNRDIAAARRAVAAVYGLTEGVQISGRMIAGEPPIVRFRRDAARIEASLPPVPSQHVRLWRGNRPGEIGRAQSFTSDLPGIALPFREPYGGDISYVDVPQEQLPVASRGGAPGVEFYLPREISAMARPVGVRVS